MKQNDKREEYKRDKKNRRKLQKQTLTIVDGRIR
jgi:hypothetical protein